MRPAARPDKLALREDPCLLNKPAVHIAQLVGNQGGMKLRRRKLLGNCHSDVRQLGTDFVANIRQHGRGRASGRCYSLVSAPCLRVRETMPWNTSLLLATTECLVPIALWSRGMEGTKGMRLAVYRRH